jgi:non-heme chloroperoxidase
MKNFLIVALMLIGSSAHIAVAQSGLDRYVGEYTIVGVPLTLAVTLEDGKLMAQATGQPKVPLTLISGEDYEVPGAPIKMTFQRDAAGKVTGVIIHQGGQDFPANKVGASTSTASSADKSPHKSSTTAANGIKMHYLDWGGTGEVMLLLAGFGNDAHIFDSFATRFTDKFRVIALTRRGFGETERPPAGYETKARVEDIRAFMDALRIDKAHLVGHSLAGDELTGMAIAYPGRVNKLVYLDAAYNRSGDRKCTDPDAPGGMPPLYKRLMAEAMNCPGAAQIVVTDMPPADMYNVMVQTMRAAQQFSPDYSKIAAPALAIYADPEAVQEPGPMDEATKKKFEVYWKNVEAPRARRSIESFRKNAKQGRVVEIKGATHYVFQGQSAEQTISLVREFLLQK